MQIKIKVRDLDVWLSEEHVLKSISLDIYKNEILAIIGPAKSGKTTFLRTLNRMIDLGQDVQVEGRVLLDGIDVYKDRVDIAELRRRLGMVFAMPTPLPGTVYQNIAFGPKLTGRKSRKELDRIVERGLKLAYLWDEVKDRLHSSVFTLSGGQQQRLCLARTLAQEPEVILLDEPCAGLDPISTGKIEEALQVLKKDYTIILVTNNVKQAARASDRTAFFLMGKLEEIATTEEIFTRPKSPKTYEYISGRFG
jgi:phosphate transport system ATP-binding protein